MAPAPMILQRSVLRANDYVQGDPDHGLAGQGHPDIFVPSCCDELQQPRTQYRTGRRAAAVLAAHLEERHSVRTSPARLKVTYAMPCPSCWGIGEACDHCQNTTWVPEEER